jgi:hypothetical protein
MNLMKYLIILFLLSLFACEKEKLPTTPTVINGIVVDENDVPIPNVYVDFYGKDIKGFRGSYTTLRLNEYSDENGTFSFSHISPNATDVISLEGWGLRDSTGLYKIPIGFKYAYFLNDQFISDYRLSIDKDDKIYGKTLVVKIIQTKE